MTKNRLTPPPGTRAVQSRTDVTFKAPRSNGAIKAIGPLTPKRLPANPPSGVNYKRSTYIRK